MARLVDESFEGTGFEETWTESVGSGCTGNEDSTGPGTMPPNGGSQCYYLVKASGAGVDAYRDMSSARTTTYVRAYVYFTALSCGSGAGYNMFPLTAAADLTGTCALGFMNDGGTYRFRLAYHTAAGWQYIYGTNTISTGTWYCVEAKFDNASSGSYELRVDGTSYGTGTGNLDRGAPRYLHVGGGGTYTETYTAYVDMVVVEDSTWVGVEEEPAPETQPILYFLQQQEILAS